MKYAEIMVIGMVMTVIGIFTVAFLASWQGVVAAGFVFFGSMIMCIASGVFDDDVDPTV